MEINLELSQKYHKEFSLSFEYNPSFYSTLNVFLNVKEFRGGSYIEGIVIIEAERSQQSILIIEGIEFSFNVFVPSIRHHAWIELDNKIIDVTLSNKIVKYFPCDYFSFQKAEEIFNEYHSGC